MGTSNQIEELEAEKLRLEIRDLRSWKRNAVMGVSLLAGAASIGGGFLEFDRAERERQIAHLEAERVHVEFEQRTRELHDEIEEREQRLEALRADLEEVTSKLQATARESGDTNLTKAAASAEGVLRSVQSYQLMNTLQMKDQPASVFLNPEFLKYFPMKEHQAPR